MACVDVFMHSSPVGLFVSVKILAFRIGLLRDAFLMQTSSRGDGCVRLCACTYMHIVHTFHLSVVCATVHALAVSLCLSICLSVRLLAG